MRRWALEKYKDGKKHQFQGKITRFSSYIDKKSGKRTETLLITDVLDEQGRPCTDHAWVAEKGIRKYGLETGKIYTFMARVGTYSRGQTAFDFQLKRLSNFKTA